MADKQFVNGLSIKTFNGEYGDILNCGINIEKITDNPINDGWLNFSIKKGRSGNWYAEISERKPGAFSSEPKPYKKEISDEEIPF